MYHTKNGRICVPTHATSTQVAQNAPHKPTASVGKPPDAHRARRAGVVPERPRGGELPGRGHAGLADHHDLPRCAGDAGMGRGGFGGFRGEAKATILRGLMIAWTYKASLTNKYVDDRVFSKLEGRFIGRGLAALGVFLGIFGTCIAARWTFKEIA